MHPNFAGALINGALYLVGVFIAGLVTEHPRAWKLALVGLGVTYIAHIMQFTAAQTGDEQLGMAGNVVVAISVLAGVIAGAFLLF